VLALGSVVAVSAQPKPAAFYRGRVSDLAPAPAVLGEKWIKATGLVIEDFSDLESQPVAVRSIVKKLRKQIEPIGVRKAADFSFRVPDEPSRFVTLRVFVFDTPESCAQWWAKKYRHDGWEKFYQPLEGKPYEAVDSKEIPKRAAAIGNVWMTCHDLDDNGDHITIMEACIEKVREAIKQD
jgi:hypothetical protein